MSTSTTVTRIELGTYGIDSVHSSIGFEVKHLGISTFRGSFSGFVGTIVAGDGGIEKIDGTIDVDSVEVPDKTLVGHLLSPDFFDAENHPQGSFTSTSVEPDGESKYRVSGDFTLRGVTHPIELTVEVEGTKTLAAMKPIRDRAFASHFVGEVTAWEARDLAGVLNRVSASVLGELEGEDCCEL